MPDYKRKRRSGFKAAPKINKKRIKNKEINADIAMKPQSEENKPQKMRVVKGKKLEQKRRVKAITYALSVLLAVVVFCELIMPAGVIETAANAVEVLGAGKYPIELESSDTLNIVSKGAYYYLLTDTKISAVSNSGKVIYSYIHGFENPVLKTSKTRAMVFDQGKKSLLIFSLSGLKTSLDFKEDEILNAAIGDDGSYAIVTKADNYAAAVNVYNKKDKLVYQWLSSEDMVNNVAISPNGKKIAISTLSSSVGNYDSKLLILNFKSANAEYTKDFKNTIIYSIDGVTKTGFVAVSEKNYNFISWKGKVITDYNNEYSANIMRCSAAGTVLVFNRESDKTDNRIAVFGKNGKLKIEITFKEIITDIALKGNSIYCLSDTSVCILDTKGNVVRKENGGFGIQRIAIIGQNKVACVTDNVISEIKLK